MKKIGIAGQNGFVGSYLFNTISLLKEEFEIVPFNRSYFDDSVALQQWVKECDVIVHLAALNRHESQQVLHDTNVLLVTKLIDACEHTASKPHIIFSSSSQESRGNLYGDSKKSGREQFAKWAEKEGAHFSGLIVPNIFGPFGLPFYNSVVATFCHQLIIGEMPKIDVDGQLKLMYVGELVDAIIGCIRTNDNSHSKVVEHTKEIFVSEILALLTNYKTQYFDNGIIPSLANRFEVNLFNTFRSFIDHGNRFPVLYKKNTDNRGTFVELVRLEVGGQVSYSTTHPDITRGNHFHTRKIERFSVIKGKALIQLRKYNEEEVLNFELDGETPSYVDMPVWYTHNIKNIGTEELLTTFWINEFYDPNDPDTYFENV